MEPPKYDGFIQRIGFNKFDYFVPQLNTIEELIEALKQDIFFKVYKNDAKRKLSSMRYMFEKDDGYHIKFMKEFLSLCYDAELINEISEVKKYLNKILKNSLLEELFADKFENIKSLDILVNKFEEIILEQNQMIKYGSCVALRHVATGKYLTSIDTTYQNNYSLVFAGKNLPTSDSLWIIGTENSDYGDNIINYRDSRILLLHKITNKKLDYIDGRCVTSFVNYHWRFRNSKSKEKRSFVKSQDIINIHIDHGKSVVRSHEITFKVGNETFQEVAYLEERIGGNDEWCIELIIN
ncbi:4993_t:CDS:2 [Funneliformis caledonium]|uniref:4993_t:CDS:1 n=1 Tax=Funneliformis caledonium TaxID=1117310 RepID=A0A9N8W5Z5_9GLOM|nr:4993_t:CDS:2 [Funneliformis caledonium]